MSGWRVPLLAIGLGCLAQAGCIGGPRPDPPPATVGEVAAALARAPAAPVVAPVPAPAVSPEPAAPAAAPIAIGPASAGGLQVSRSQAIAAYRDYLALSDPTQSLHAPALQRLADLMQADLDERDALSVGGGAEPPTEAEREAVADLYRELLATYPDRAENASAWYQLARTEEGMGNLEGALVALGELSLRYPQTGRLDEVHFRRGEYYFALRDFAAAGRAYALVIAEEDSDFHEQALYKRGWSLFRLQQYEPALDMFVRVLNRHALDADSDPAGLSGPEGQRVLDTLDVMALDFDYQGGVGRIAPYFDRRGRPPWEALVYERLGEQYLDRQRYTDAAAAFEAFTRRDPLARRAPHFRLRAMAALGKGGFDRQQRELRERLVADYGMDQPYWQRWDRSEAPQLTAAIRETVEDFASYHHARSQSAQPGSRGRADVAAAVGWYRKRIDWFPQHPQTAGVVFLLGELLYENGRDRDAVVEYERSAYAFAAHPKAAEAGYAALLAYERAGPRIAEAQRADWQQAAIASALRFGQKFGSDPRAPGAMLRAARGLFDSGDGVRARQVAAEVVRRFPQADAEIRHGAHMVLGQQAFEAADFAAAEAGFVQALAVLGPRDKRRADVTERLAASIYRQGEQQRDAGRLDLAATQFLRVGQVAPASPIRVNADFDAAAVLLQDHQWERAASVLVDFRRRYPGSELQQQVTRELAVAYLESEQWLQAAKEFQRLVRTTKDASLKREATWQSAELFARAGERKQSIDAWAAYVRAYPSPVDRAMEARLKLLAIFRAAGDTQSVRRWQRALIAADARAGKERNDRTRFLAATAQLELAEAEIGRFRNIKLVAPIRRNIQRKRDAMQSSLAALGKAAEYDIASVTTAATYYTGELYYGFSRDLLESERPRDLDEEALEEYELLLEEQAYPFEEKAIDAHGLNVGRTAEGLYDEWVRRSFEQMAKLLPARYAKEERSVGVMAQLD